MALDALQAFVVDNVVERAGHPQRQHGLRQLHARAQPLGERERQMGTLGWAFMAPTRCMRARRSLLVMSQV
jgi:hypothetical protein